MQPSTLLGVHNKGKTIMEQLICTPLRSLTKYFFAMLFCLEKDLHNLKVIKGLLQAMPKRSR